MHFASLFFVLHIFYDQTLYIKTNKHKQIQLNINFNTNFCLPNIFLLQSNQRAYSLVEKRYSPKVKIKGSSPFKRAFCIRFFCNFLCNIAKK